jgi:hypothetical protein
MAPVSRLGVAKDIGALRNTGRVTSTRELLTRLRQGYLDESGSAAIDGADAAEVFAGAIGEHAAPDFTVTMDGGAMTTTYVGIEGLIEGWTDFVAAFEAIEIHPEEILETPDGKCAVEFVRLKGRPKGVAADIDHEAAAVWRAPDGVLSAVEFHMSRDAALRSAGIEPGGTSEG